MGALSSIPSEALRVLRQTDIVTLAARGLVLGHAIVAIVALVIVLHHTALADPRS